MDHPSAGSRPRRYWALLADPTRYDIERAVRDLDVDSWMSKRSDLRPGDRVVVWKAKGGDPVRGIVALGEVLSNPELRGWEHESDAGYWRRPPPAGRRELRVDVRYVVPPGLPLWLSGPADNMLRDLTVSRGQGTVFKVAHEQWEAVVEAAGGWPDETPEIADVRATIEERAGKRTSGQGFQVSPEVRRAIEQYAMERAVVHFSDRGWQVEDVSATRSYDLHCTKASGEELRVEVKGTTGDGSQVLLTPNEVQHARERFPHVALFVVASIKASKGDDGKLITSGGVEQLFEPWDVDAGRLMPLGFAYTPGMAIRL